jgi:hypothetical protein
MCRKQMSGKQVPVKCIRNLSNKTFGSFLLNLFYVMGDYWLCQFKSQDNLGNDLYFVALALNIGSKLQSRVWGTCVHFL